MHPTTTLPVASRHGLKVRLQSPYLGLPDGQTDALAQVVGDDMSWNIVNGAVQATVTLSRMSADQWAMRTVLANQGKEVEVRLSLPYLFYRYRDGQPARHFNPTFGGLLETGTLPVHVTYPGPATYCLAGVAGIRSTCAMGLFDAEQRCVTIRHFPAGHVGQMRMLFDRVLLRKGQTLTLPDGFIAIGGDWSEAFAPYKAWFAEAFPRPRPRIAWFADEPWTETRKACCVVPIEPEPTVPGLWVFDDTGKPRTLARIKREIDEAVTDGKRKHYRPLFYQFGWWQTLADLKGLFSFDSFIGDFQQGHATARQIVDYVHAKQARVHLYTNIMAAGDESLVWKQHPDLFVSNRSGNAAWNGGYPMLMFCPGAPGIRAYWERVLRTILVDLDADGLFLDQFAGGFPPQYCYCPEHRHAHPDTYGADMLALVDWIAKRARELKPDALVSGELILDTRSVLLDETHGYGYVQSSWKAPKSRTVARRTPPSEYFVFAKYLCPEVLGHYCTWSEDRLTGVAIMNGTAGHHADPVWHRWQRIFEHGCRPCPVDPCGGLAYLYGPVDGQAVLAVRSPSGPSTLTVRLPKGYALAKPQSGVQLLRAGLRVAAGPKPCFIHLVEG